MGYFVLSQREFVRILHTHGFRPTSQRGSHQFWERPGFKVTVDVKYTEYSGWLLARMIHQSGLPKVVFRLH